MATKPRYPHSIHVPEDIEMAFRAYQEENGIPFQSFVLELMRKALIVDEHVSA